MLLTNKSSTLFPTTQVRICPIQHFSTLKSANKCLDGLASFPPIKFKYVSHQKGWWSSINRSWPSINRLCPPIKDFLCDCFNATPTPTSFQTTSTDFLQPKKVCFHPNCRFKADPCPKMEQVCNQSINLLVESPPNIDKNQQIGVFVFPRRGQKNGYLRKPKLATFCRQIPSSFRI